MSNAILSVLSGAWRLRAPPALATWNPQDKGAGITLSNGNITASNTGGGNVLVRGVSSRSAGKFYFEYAIGGTSTSAAVVGLATGDVGVSNYMFVAGCYGWRDVGTYYINGNPAGAPSFTIGDRVMVAVDLNAGKIWFGKNGTWNNGDPGSGGVASMTFTTPQTLFPCSTPGSGTTAITLEASSSQFLFPAPTGFSAWTPVIAALGTPWTIRTTPFSSTNQPLSLTGIAYGANLFVACSTYVTIDSNNFLTSPNGINWAMGSGSSYILKGICFANNLFIAVGNGTATSNILSSPDGLNWTPRITPNNPAYKAVTFGNGVFVTVANGDPNAVGRVATSPDGITWTARSCPVGAWSSITFGNGVFVAVSADGLVMTSPDGITWTLRTATSNLNWNSVAYGNGLFVAVASNGLLAQQIMTSPDGITWTAQTAAANLAWQGITFGGGLFVAVANSGVGNRVMTSADGFAWTSRASAVDQNWACVAYNGSIFAAGGTPAGGSGNNNYIMTSP